MATGVRREDDGKTQGECLVTVPAHGEPRRTEDCRQLPEMDQEGRGPPLSPQERANPADTLIPDLEPPDWEAVHVRGLSLLPRMLSTAASADTTPRSG